MAVFTPNTKLGILGGGQLARMLAQSAQQLGLVPVIYSAHPEDPAAQVCPNWYQGEPSDVKAMADFLKQVHMATFESEFLDPSILEQAKKVSRTQIFPKIKTMGQLQDRKTQKELLDASKIPTSPWCSPNTKEAALAFLQTNGYPLVFKKRHFGYDGYGTYIIKTKKQWDEFLDQHFEPSKFILEKFIPFEKEMAFIVGRSRDGSFTHFPLVESKQKKARCFWVKGPARHKDEQIFVRKFSQFLKKHNYIGVMGVEFFAGNGKLMVNEIAPRVHNTGHYTLDTEGPSQFDVHWMCLLGEKLPKSIKIKNGFAMVNLLGKGAKKIELEPTKGLHWYGKQKNPKGRKMGHINVVAKNSKLALAKALALEKRMKI